MNNRGSIFIVLLGCVAAVAAMGVTVYETGPTNGLKSGAWDMNILADDVHLRCGGIITNVMMLLSIKSTQTCSFWIFDGFGEDAIYSVPFTNTRSSWSGDFHEYNFPMHLSVPPDIYVGFSATNGGWGDLNTDNSANAMVVSNGIAANPGVYWWGRISDGRLNQGANFGSGDYFKLRIDMLQPEISGLSVSNGLSFLAITNLSEHATYLVERSHDMLSNAWDEAGEFTTNASCALWSEELSNDWHNVLYRVRTKPVQ